VSEIVEGPARAKWTLVLAVKHRADTLREVKIPTLVVQGENDPFGTRAEVRKYRLKKPVAVHWLPHGDHSFGAPKRSGRTAAQNIDAAVAAVLEFLATL
jgi:predicted alpha/beta-hydrolase family hydrolase